MKHSESQTFSIDNFEGPIDLLWHLISKDEIDIYEICLKQLTRQYLQNEKNADIDFGAEFIATAAALVYLKSKTLLPKHEQQQEEVEEEIFDPNFDVIHHLVDYCHFKQAARTLTEREEQQSAFYFRGAANIESSKKLLGIDHISLDDLAGLFQQMLSKASVRKGTIHEEEWKVSDKIRFLRLELKGKGQLSFVEVFGGEKGRIELIVTFLALLELIKIGEVKVGQDRATHEVIIMGYYGEGN